MMTVQWTVPETNPEKLINALLITFNSPLLLHYGNIYSI